LVVSRLINSWDYDRHGLEEWGGRLGVAKPEYTDWTGGLTDEMIHRCERDVDITEGVFKFFKKYIEDPRLKKAMQIEHRAAIICREMFDNGFGFDIDGCELLHRTIESEVRTLEAELQSAFPPKQVLSRTILPKPTKSGAISKVDFRWLRDGETPESVGAVVGVPYPVFETEVFNPGSVKQCIERLNELGWKPTEKTKGHIKAEKERDSEKLEKFQEYGWKLSEENLKTLPPDAPEAAKTLTRYILLSSRLSSLDEWKGWYNQETKAIHGSINPIGTWTHRGSHKNPNTGNITGVEAEFGPEMRSLWNAGKGYRQIGCDAEQIQLRILAHYMNDPDFTKALEQGRSEDGTDVHTLNMKKLNGDEIVCAHRKTAKTFIFSYVLGSGIGNTAMVFGCSFQKAKESRERFVNAFPGLKKLKEELLVEDAKRGYFIGIDGRPVMCDNAHLMLAGYLQNGEAIIMKEANWQWRSRLLKEKIPFWQMGWVHDEWQTRTIDDEDVANYIGQIQAEEIKRAGETFDLKCELAGSYKIGYNWKDCH
jgi:DNA polymerase-1